MRGGWIRALTVVSAVGAGAVGGIFLAFSNSGYLTRWTAWNHVRTLAAIAASLLLFLLTRR